MSMEDKLERIAVALEKLHKSIGDVTSTLMAEVPAKKPKTTGAAIPPTAPSTPGIEPTKEMVRESLLELSNQEGCSRETALTVLSRFKATTIGKLEPKHYADCLALSQRVIADGPKVLSN